ncbi:MAG TPA: M1 family aminopeptidase [Bryobacteraceae bacterium]|nr:M1 family aminopeptidase [Bryobacteraceae bacterium]
MVRLSPLLLLLTLHAHAAPTTAADLARQLHEISLDPDECYRVIELNFVKEDLKIYLNSGFLIFSKPIAGVRSAAVFVANQEAGDAEVLIMPPVRSERLSLSTFTNSPNLNEHFKTAVMVFSDNTAAELLAEMQANPSMKKTPEDAPLLSDPWSSVVRNLTDSFIARLVNDLISGDRKIGMFYMAIGGLQLGTFDVLYDPTAHEQIFAGKIVYNDNRTYFDTWTSFPARSARRSSAADGPRFSLDNFRIDSVIDSDLRMKAVTRFTLTPKRPLGATISFNMSSSMHATAAAIDGHPVEVFQRESIRSNLISSNDNDLIVLIPETPLDPAHPHEIEIHHEGQVIQDAGDGVYFVTSRGTWYPRVGTEFATYDLTFHYPKNLTVVATGAVVDDHTDGDTRVTHRKTDVPVRFAGFNLGDFQSVSAVPNGYKIDVYANRHVEAALETKGSPATLTPGVSNPAPRLELIAKDVANAVEFMTEKFGPPPLPYLSVTPIPGTFGQGFPGLVYISTLAYLNSEQRPPSMRDRAGETFFSQLLEAHETAHQWWGNMVVAAGYQDEWLIESLANYSALLLMEKTKGSQTVDALLADYKADLLAKLKSGRTLESAGPISWGFRLQSSIAPHAWRTVTYEKGTWIMHMLRRRLGDEKFLAFLRELCTRYRFATVSTEQFRELAAQYTPPGTADASLKAFFDTWVYGTGIPAVKMTYAFKGTKLTGTLVEHNVDDEFTTFVPLEVRTKTDRKVYWLAAASDTSTFSIPLKTPPTKVTLLGSDWLMTTPK